MLEVVTLFAGIIYGLVVGLVPSVGATTGLVLLFPWISAFADFPYLGVIFCVAATASSTTGDTFAGVLLGIPGANSAAATMVDGFPLAVQGKASYALSAALFTSTINGLLWGSLTFLFLPFYVKLILILGIPELWGFTVLAFVTVGFVSSKYWVRSLLALAVGIWMGLIGYDVNASARWTFGWEYLLDGIQIMPFVAGLFAIPEICASFGDKKAKAFPKADEHRKQLWEGIRISCLHWKLALTGGLIGSVIGILPGLGGAIADWLAYGQAVARNSAEEFGNGNIKGVIGCEGANNAQKASSFIPTVLFGIPGAPFAAVLMGLFMYLDFEMGTLELCSDTKFFNSLSFAFLLGTAITGIVCFFLVRWVSYLVYVPATYYRIFLLVVIIWSCLQYTGGWEDVAILGILSIIGLSAKKFCFSRPSLLIGYILADRIEKLSWQTFELYKLTDLIQRPIFLLICFFIVIIITIAFKGSNKIDFV